MPEVRVEDRSLPSTGVPGSVSNHPLCLVGHVEILEHYPRSTITTFLARTMKVRRASSTSVRLTKPEWLHPNENLVSLKGSLKCCDALGTSLLGNQRATERISGISISRTMISSESSIPSAMHAGLPTSTEHSRALHVKR